MPQFSEEDINAARRRVQEMRNRASRFTGEDTAPVVHTNASNVTDRTEKKNESAPLLHERREEKQQVKENDNEGESDNDNQDKSFLIILALLLLLSKEKADNNLILALLYLLL